MNQININADIMFYFQYAEGLNASLIQPFVLLAIALGPIAVRTLNTTQKRIGRSQLCVITSNAIHGLEFATSWFEHGRVIKLPTKHSFSIINPKFCPKYQYEPFIMIYYDHNTLLFKFHVFGSFSPCYSVISNINFSIIISSVHVWLYMSLVVLCFVLK